MNAVFSRTGLIILALILFTTLITTWLTGTSGPATHTSIVSPHSSDSVTLPDPEMLAARRDAKAPAVPQAPPITEAEQLVNELTRRLQTEFAERIHDIAFQVSLKDMRDGLLTQFPMQGEQLFARIIHAAFPSLAEEILRNIALMDHYDAWLLDNMVALNDMDLLSQQGEIWAKRRALFGADAERIWSDELSAQAERKAAVQRTVQLLNTAYDTTMNERIFVLKTAFEEGLAGSPQEAVLDTKGVMAQVFFGFDSVQRELESLAPQARQTQINTIRRQMGFDETSVAQLAEQDQQREARWQNGYAYMAERRELEARAGGQPSASELDALREKYFAHEAVTIKREEEDLGFFRYTRPRVYGRN